MHLLAMFGMIFCSFKENSNKSFAFEIIIDYNFTFYFPVVSINASLIRFPRIWRPWALSEACEELLHSTHHAPIS